MEHLPLLNACLNSLSAILLSAGYYFITQRNVRMHRRCMVAAFVTSSVFLVSYLVYHANVGAVHYTGGGIGRTVYLMILATHTVLAASVPVLSIITLVRAMKKRFTAHRSIARWTLPVWLYVSVTGVVIYIVLYRVSA